MKADVSPIETASLLQEFHRELIAIADWWATNAVDHEYGGFHGEISAANVPTENASKGLILNARILWFFSEVAQVIDNDNYRRCAQRAYVYLVNHFLDKDFGGFFWELDAYGKPINTRKQIYGQAFSIYGLCAYFSLTRDSRALGLAQSCFDLIERHGVDRQREGYLEAFTQEWGVINDLRLSEKDLNFPKSQNTHLHILEAYTRLYQIDQRAEVRAALRYNIDMFDKHMIDKKTYHLRMFMDLDWNDFSPGYTYGHDIEASWLIAQALESLGDDRYSQSLTPTLINIAETTLKEGVGPQGYIMDSYDFASHSVNNDAVWWVQAEALVGFLYAFSVTRDTRFYHAAKNVWAFIKKYQKDNECGEWFWLAKLDATTVNNELADTDYYKAGFWKCPYHNGRAMLEAMSYLQRL